MLKNCVILLLLSASNHLILVLSVANSVSSEDLNKFDILNEILVFLLEDCEFGIRNVVIYDDTDVLLTFKAVSLLQQPMSVTFLSNLDLIRNREIYRETVLVDVLILIVDVHQSSHGIDTALGNKWVFQNNCTIFIIPKQYSECSSASDVLLWTRRFYLPATYYICLYERREPLSITLKLYENMKPQFWELEKVLNSAGKKWSMYYRYFYKDAARTCKGYQFKRQHSNKVYVTLGIVNNYVQGEIELEKNFYYDEQLEPYFDPELLILIDQLRTLLKIDFLYYIMWETDFLEFTFDDYDESQVDIIIFYQFLITTKFSWLFFYPTDYDDYSILSYNRGLKTPLEKIASFYGFWTLISLISLSTLVFIVVWLKTNKNVYSAFFNVLRLLIDSGVNVPIDTLSLKIFFSMIFMYFLIIHATFSGHLAKFLTKSTLKENIESLEDLLDPQITTIFNHGFTYGNIDGLEILESKTTYIKVRDMCPISVEKTPNSACISLAFNLRAFRVNREDWNYTYYISKNKLRPAASAYLYRPGFPLREKMNLAIMFLFETKTLDRGIEQTWMQDSMILEKQSKLSDIDFRLITMNDLNFAFMLLAIGNSFGLIVFLCELFIDWYRRKNKTKNRVSIRKPIKKKTHLKITVREKKVHSLPAVDRKFLKSLKSFDNL